MPVKPTNNCLECGKRVLYYKSIRCRSCWFPNFKYSHESPNIRFFRSVRKTAACWLWTGSKLKGGYGQFLAFGQIQAHRVSWVLHNGEIPKGLSICHTCDNPSCVNPKHLWLGTTKQNLRDAMKKGRIFYGEKNGANKLRDEDVIKIREKYSRGRARSLATEFNVSIHTIYNIVRRDSWGHL